MMNWEQLLSDQRYDGIKFFSRIKQQNLDADVTDYVTVFQEDIHRILYAPSFRRLQNKTQVHPLPRSDYYRTRLTHSIEVAHAGCLVAATVGRWLEKEQKLPKGRTPADIADITYAACLAHDLGNPPFGHNGEEAIQSWFEQSNYGIVNEVKTQRPEAADFKIYDGNAQGFHILCATQGWKGEGGMRLSAATLGAFTKYPFQSEIGLDRFEKSIGKKKSGYFESDRAYAEAIFSHLGLPRRADGSFLRHPLAYIVEAADDICYNITDIEDGVKAKLISFQKGTELLLNCSTEAHRPHWRDFNNRDDPDDMISYLRAAAISSLIDDCYSVFVRRYDDICKDILEGGLLAAGRYKEPILKIREQCENEIYPSREKLEVEAGGYSVVYYLLDTFCRMFQAFYDVGGDPKKLDKRSTNLYFLFPKEYRANLVCDSCVLLRKLVDYVSGMSDKYAIDLFKKISGAGLTIGL